MNAETTWSPSAPLAAAVLSALAGLARQWPKAMAIALETTDAGRQYMADFAFAMKGADLRAIPLAARAWVADNSMPPKPADLGRLAREITQAQFPSTFREPVRVEMLPTAHLKNPGRINTLSHRAQEALGSRRLVGEVLALLLQSAPPDQREAVRRGDVASEVFDDAVTAVQRGVRATRGGVL